MDDLVIYFMATPALAIIPGWVAYRKGNSFWTAWFFSLLISPIIMLVIVLFSNRDEEELERRRLSGGMKRCDHCKSVIHKDASVCPTCTRDLPAYGSAAA